MDVFASADLFYRLAQGLTPQQMTYRNHIIRINQQAHALAETVDSILHPEIAKIRHPNWQARNVMAPTHGPMPLTGQTLLRPETLSLARTLENLAVRLTNIVVNRPDTAIQDIIPLFNQIAGTFETIRSSSASGPIMMLPDFSIPIRQIRDSLSWMNQYQQTALRQAGQSAMPTV